MLKSAVSSLRSLPGHWRETDPSIRRKRILVFLLIILHILPLWIFKYFPTQDGPAHVYNSYVLRAFHDEESTLLREYYTLNLTLFPNWFSHAFMMVLMYTVPPLVAAKILLSIIIALFPLSLFYFLGSVHKGKNLYGFLGFLFSYHYLLHMGFYNYFPLDWKTKHSGVIDYIVAWKLDRSNPHACGDDIMRAHDLDVQEITDSLDADYDLIHSTENLKVYRYRTEHVGEAELAIHRVMARSR